MRDAEELCEDFVPQTQDFRISINSSY